MLHQHIGGDIHQHYKVPLTTEVGIREVYVFNRVLTINVHLTLVLGMMEMEVGVVHNVGRMTLVDAKQLKIERKPEPLFLQYMASMVLQPHPLIQI